MLRTANGTAGMLRTANVTTGMLRTANGSTAAVGSAKMKTRKIKTGVVPNGDRNLAASTGRASSARFIKPRLSLRD
jgi:hypothetical protein